MLYGLVDISNLEEEGFCVIDDLPEGDGLDRVDAAKPSSGERASDVYPAGASVKMSKELGGMELPDFVSNTWSLLIVHRRIKEAIESVVGANAEYLSLKVINHKGRIASADYFIVNPIGTHDVLDLDASDIKWFEGEVVKVKQFVLDAAKLKKAPDLFRPREAPEEYFFSERVAAEIIKLEPRWTNLHYVDLFDIEGVS